MSWLYSRALVEAFSAASCLDGEPSAPLSGSHTPHAYLPSDRTTAFSRLSRFGMTFAPLTDTLGADVLTWFLAGFPVRTSASQARATGLTASDPVCGESSRASWVKYDPASCSWRTAQFSLLGGLDEFSEIWPRSGSMRHGECYPLLTLVPRICANESGLWPTPVADDTGSRSKRYAQGGTPLSLAVKLYPTPTSCSGNNVGRLDEWGGSRSREVMRTLVPPEELTGPLNPTWVEWLMGWPLGWTDLKPLETGKCRSVQQQPGACSPLETEAA
jgi:hypothetical protein